MSDSSWRRYTFRRTHLLRGEFSGRIGGFSKSPVRLPARECIRVDMCSPRNSQARKHVPVRSHQCSCLASRLLQAPLHSCKPAETRKHTHTHAHTRAHTHGTDRSAACCFCSRRAFSSCIIRICFHSFASARCRAYSRCWSRSLDSLTPETVVWPSLPSAMWLLSSMSLPDASCCTQSTSCAAYPVSTSQYCQPHVVLPRVTSGGAACQGLQHASVSPFSWFPLSCDVV